MKFIRNWKISLPVAGVVLAGLAWLAFGYFGVQTAFIDDEVSEAAPAFDIPAAPTNMPDDSVAEAEVPETAAPQADEVVTEEAAESTDETTDAAADEAAPVGPRCHRGC